MRCSQKPSYSQQGLLGKGSFAEVYKVRLQGKLYALKRIYPFHLKNPKYYKDLKRQISIMQKLNHPNIVQLVDIYETQNSLELLLQYLPGGNLYDKIKSQDRVPESVVRQYILDIVRAVKYLHSFPQPILHRDIKPQNILLSENNVVKICDFGSANMILPDQYRDSYVGTAQYMAPQMKLFKPHDQSLDLWCIGILMYQLLTGNVPQPQKQIQYPNFISRPAQDLIKKILVKQQNKRISIEQIESHIWFTLPRQHFKVSDLRFKQKREQKQEFIQRVKNKSKKLCQNLSNIPKLQKKIPQLITSTSIINKFAQQNIQNYIEDLKNLCILQQKTRKNQLYRKKLQENNQKMIKIKSQLQIAMREKIDLIQLQNEGLKQKQKRSEYKCIEALNDLKNRLSKIEEVARYYPKYYKDRILTFNEPIVEPTSLPIGEYLPKLKLKMLEQRRDSLIQLKCLGKRKKQLEMLIYVPQSDSYNLSEAEISTQNILMRDNI